MTGTPTLSPHRRRIGVELAATALTLLIAGTLVWSVDRTAHVGSPAKTLEDPGPSHHGTQPPPPGSGIWIGRDEVMQRPTSGAAWDRLLADARRDPGSAAISDQDSNHDVYTLAAALVCVRVGKHCQRARGGVLDAIGTEEGGRWLAVGRNLGAYVIAADLLDLRGDGIPGSAGTRVESWIEGWLTRQLRNNNTPDMRGFGPFHAGANAAAQEGFAYAAVAAYLRDQKALERAWSAFRTYVCDRGITVDPGITVDRGVTVHREITDREEIDLAGAVRDDWAHDDRRPCAIAPAGAAKRVPPGAPGAGEDHLLDGSLIADMRRGGTYRWPPGYSHYPWVGLEGLVPAAVILHRAGYPSFDIADRAVLRTHEYLWRLRTSTGDERWFDGIRAREVVHLVNMAYGTSFPVEEPTGAGRTVGYTDWTHPRWPMGRDVSRWLELPSSKGGEGVQRLEGGS